MIRCWSKALILPCFTDSRAWSTNLSKESRIAIRSGSGLDDECGRAISQAAAPRSWPCRYQTHSVVCSHADCSGGRWSTVPAASSDTRILSVNCSSTWASSEAGGGGTAPEGPPSSSSSGAATRKLRRKLLTWNVWYHTGDRVTVGKAVALPLATSAFDGRPPLHLLVHAWAFFRCSCMLRTLPHM